MSNSTSQVVVLGLALALGTAASSQAHHSQSQFNLDPAVIETISGTVTQYVFKNPHAYLMLETTEADGSTAHWELEASSTPNLVRRGWRTDSVQVGDELTIDIHPAKIPGQHIARIAMIYLPDGNTLAVRGEGGIPRIADESARAASLAGRWLGRWGLLQVQIDLDQWPLTPEGREAQASFDILQNPQIDCVPVASPTFMLYSNIFDVTIVDDFIRVQGEWLDVERIIYLDGRSHPPADELSLQGHSVGHWEGETLVVDTTNYEPHGVGNAFQIPSGVRKHLVERLTLSEDGKRVEYAFELEDPEYLTEAVIGTTTWDYRPDLEPHRIECDPVNARRFLERMLPRE